MALVIDKKGIMTGSPEKVNLSKRTPNVSGALIKPTVLILHDTASGLDVSGPVGWLCNPAAKASAHFVVGRNGFKGAGEVYQLAPTNVKTWHAGKSSYRGVRNVNNFSIGIEIVNPGWLTSKDGKVATFSRGTPSWNVEKYGIHQVTDDSHPGKYWWMSYTMEQIEAVIAMARAIVAAYPTIKDIEAHFTISPGRKVDVNPLFPMERVRAAVFSNRGPVVEEAPKNVVEEPKNVEPAEQEKDENYDYDAVATTNLNLRPWPDSPNRFGVIKVDKPVDIIRQSISKVNGDVWYFVAVKKDAIHVEPGVKADADGLYRGFCHSKFLRLVD